MTRASVLAAPSLEPVGDGAAECKGDDAARRAKATMRREIIRFA